MGNSSFRRIASKFANLAQEKPFKFFIKFQKILDFPVSLWYTLLVKMKGGRNMAASENKMSNDRYRTKLVEKLMPTTLDGLWQ